MSRFFHGSDSDTESSSSSSSSGSGLSSDEELITKQPIASGRPPTAGRFGRGDYSDSDSDEDVKRIVKSTKDKRFDEMRACVKKIESARKTNNWVALAAEFDKLAKMVTKSRSIIEQSGIPNFYIRALVNLEDVFKEAQENKDNKKKMNVSNAKAMNAMKQKLRRNNKLYEKEIEEFRKNPVNSDDEMVKEETEESESESSSDEKEARPKGRDAWKKKPAAPKHRFMKKDQSEDEDESESEDEDLFEPDSGDEGRSRGPSRWKKFTGEKKPKAKSVEEKIQERKVAFKASKKGMQIEEKGDEEEDDDGFTPVGKGGKPVVYTTENLFKKLREIIVVRGKKNTDRLEHIKVLRELLKVAATPFQKIRVLLVLISTQFDYTPGIGGYMNIEMWKSTERDINLLLSILEENKQYTVYEDAVDTVEMNEESDEIRGSIVTFIDRLDDEFTRSLQNIDPHTTDYVERLKGGSVVYATIVRSQAYFQAKDLKDCICRVIMRRLEHLYYKPDQVAMIVEKAAITALPENVANDVTYADENPAQLIHRLCIYLYKHGQPLLRTRAMLCHIYHHALHGRFYVARDMLLMSHLQETIPNTDIATQVLYNRAMVQIGLCAFRLGMINDAQTCLADICSSGRVKELLAQGVQHQRLGTSNPEQEKLERQRQLPFHIHVNLELLECVYLTCSMLLEIPLMAQAGSLVEARRKISSKPFRRLLDYSDRQAFVGPPENTRDHIVAASKALLVGEWQRCQKYIGDIKIWELMPETEKITEMLSRKIQGEGLRTYLFSNGAYYANLRLSELASSFKLPEQDVRKQVARMIFEEELQASLDQTRGLLVMQRVEPTRLQALALVYADKISMMVDDNERAMDVKLGSDRQGGQRDQQRDNRTGRGGRSGRGGRAARGGGRAARGGGRGGSSGFGNRDRRNQGENDE